MLLEIAVADAYGVCFESCDKDEITPNNTLEYHENMPPSFIKRGCYSDDAQMSLAIAESVLHDEIWTRLLIATRILLAFKRDKRRGYTGPFYNILEEVKTAEELLATIDGKSKKSGAAMRSHSCGLYPNLSDVIERTIIQANVTHNTWIGRESAICVAMMTHYFAYDLGLKDHLVEWLRDHRFADKLHSPHSFEIEGDTVTCWNPSKNRVSTFGWDCIEAALYAIESSDSMKQILWQCCEYAGDTDTVAAIALGAASWSRDIAQDLPENLINDLEDKKFGRTYLMSLDLELRKKFSL